MPTTPELHPCHLNASLPKNDEREPRGPLPLDAGEDRERQYRYVVVGSYVISSTVETSDWRLETAGPPAGEGWEAIEKRIVDGNEIACPEPSPVKNNVTTKYGECVPGADTVKGEQRTITYKWVLKDFKWESVVDTDDTVNVSRLLNEKEQEACTPSKPPLVITAEVGNPVCDSKTIETAITTTTYTYKYVDGKWVESSTPVVTNGSRNLRDEERFPCPVPPVVPPVVASNTPIPQPEATREVVSAFPPAQAPTTTAPAPAATIPAAGLPATGSNGTGVAALIALLVTSLGGAALLAARRRTATS